MNITIQIPARWFYRVIPGDRLYRTPLSTYEWMRIDPEPVYVIDLYTTQNRLDTWSIIKYYLGKGQSKYCVDKIPHIVMYQGKLWVNDGNHRIAAYKLQGRNKVLARVWKHA